MNHPDSPSLRPRVPEWGGDSLFAGLDRKRKGQARVSEAVDPEWVERFDRALRFLAAAGEPFTVERALKIAGYPEGHPNAIGARTSAAVKAGVMRKTGNYRAATRGSRHGAVVAEWVGP